MTVDQHAPKHQQNPEPDPLSAEALWAKLQQLRPNKREMILALVYAVADDRVTPNQFEQWWAERGMGLRDGDEVAIAECTAWLKEVGR